MFTVQLWTHIHIHIHMIGIVPAIGHKCIYSHKQFKTCFTSPTVFNNLSPTLLKIINVSKSCPYLVVKNSTATYSIFKCPMHACCRGQTLSYMAFCRDRAAALAAVATCSDWRLQGEGLLIATCGFN